MTEGYKVEISASDKATQNLKRLFFALAEVTPADEGDCERCPYLATEGGCNGCPYQDVSPRGATT